MWECVETERRSGRPWGIGEATRESMRLTWMTEAGKVRPEVLILTSNLPRH
jgi:hypothetical protein